MFKKLLFIMLNIGLYVSSLYFGFWEHNILYFFIIVLVFFVFVHFLVIELKKHVKPRGYFLFALGGFVFTILFVGFDNLFLIISIGLYHLGLFFLCFAVDDELLNRKVISLWTVVHNGTYTFTVFMTLTFASLLLAIFHTFPFNCDSLYSYSDQVIDKVKQTFNLETEKAINIKQKIKDTSETTVPQFLGISLPSFLDNTTKENTDLLDENIDIENETGDEEHIGVLGYFEKMKTRLVDQVIKDNKVVNKGICDYLVEAIADRFSHPAFQFSAMFLMFLLLSPFLRIITFTLEIVIYILLWLMILLRIYKFEKVPGEVEDLM